MADNVIITPGTGNTVAADEVVDGTLGTVKVQYTKIMDGTLDSTNKLIVSSAGAAKVDGSAVTQPVSLTSTTLTGNVTVVQPTGTNLHTVLDSGTTTVTQATGTNLHTVIDSGTTTVTQATGTNLHTVLDSGTLTTITNAVTVAQATAANLNATVTQQTLTKGTQGSTGVSTQDLKDAGRNYVTFTANATAGVTAEALFSFNQTKQGTATASVTSYTVTNGKTLRITGLYLSNQDGTTTTSFGRAILRHNTAGATTTSSPVVAIIQTGGSAALAGSTGYASAAFPDGIEIYGNGTQSIGVSHLDQATTNVVCCTLTGYEY